MVENVLLERAPWMLVIAGAVFVFLYLELRRTLFQFQSRWTQRQQTLHSEVGSLRSTVQDLKSRMAAAERATETLVPPQPPRCGMNISQRAQAIRLFRRGQRPDQIASAVGMSENEAELLGRIYRIADRASPAAAEPETKASAEPP